MTKKPVDEEKWLCGEVIQHVGGDTDGTSTEQGDIPYHAQSCPAYKGGGRRWKRKPLELYFSSQLTMVESCSPAGPREGVNEFLALLCLCVWLLFSLLHCLYLSLWVFSLLPFLFSPPCHQGWASEWLCVPWLPAGIKPPQHFIQDHPECLKKRSGFAWWKTN